MLSHEASGIVTKTSQTAVDNGGQALTGVISFPNKSRKLMPSCFVLYFWYFRKRMGPPHIRSPPPPPSTALSTKGRPPAPERAAGAAERPAGAPARLRAVVLRVPRDKQKLKRYEDGTADHSLKVNKSWERQMKERKRY